MLFTQRSILLVMHQYVHPRSHAAGASPPCRRDSVIGWEATLGPFTQAMVDRIASSNPILEQGFRPRGFQRVDEKHGPERTEAACHTALGFGSRSHDLRNERSPRTNRPRRSRSRSCPEYTPPMYFQTFRQFQKQLVQLEGWLDKAEAHAEVKKFDPAVYAALRLAPDQLPFATQILIACDTAKLGASRITGKDAPKHEDTEKSLDELRERVRSVVAYLETFTEADFASVAERTVTQPRWNGKIMSAPDYFMEHVLPNFYFHLSHTYAILRHNGVPLGKRDYLGALSQREP